MVPVEVITDRAPTYPKVVDSLWPTVWHHVGRYANNRVEADHAQLKRWLRPMRGVKTMAGLRVLAAGHAFAHVRTFAPRPFEVEDLSEHRVVGARVFYVNHPQRFPT